MLGYFFSTEPNYPLNLSVSKGKKRQAPLLVPFHSVVSYLNGLKEKEIDIVCQSKARFLLTNANIYGSQSICVDKWHCRGRKSRVFLLSAASSFFWWRRRGAAFQSAAAFQHTVIVRKIFCLIVEIYTGLFFRKTYPLQFA